MKPHDTRKYQDFTNGRLRVIILIECKQLIVFKILTEGLLFLLQIPFLCPILSKVILLFQK